MLEISVGVLAAPTRRVLCLATSLLAIGACAAGSDANDDSNTGSGGQGTGGVAAPGSGGVDGMTMATGSGGMLGGSGGMLGGSGGMLGGSGGMLGGSGGMSGAAGTSGGTGGITGTGGAMSGSGGSSGMVDPKCGASAHCAMAEGMMVCVDNTTSMPPACTSGGSECTTALPGSACATLPAGGMGCVLGCGMATADQCAAGLTCQDPFSMGAFCADSSGLPPTCDMANGNADCTMYAGTVCTMVSILTGCFKSCTL